MYISLILRPVEGSKIGIIATQESETTKYALPSTSASVNGWYPSQVKTVRHYFLDSHYKMMTSSECSSLVTQTTALQVTWRDDVHLRTLWTWLASKQNEDKKKEITNSVEHNFALNYYWFFFIIFSLIQLLLVLITNFEMVYKTGERRGWSIVKYIAIQAISPRLSKVPNVLAMELFTSFRISEHRGASDKSTPDSPEVQKSWRN